MMDIKAKKIITYSKASLGEVCFIWMCSKLHRTWPIHLMQTSVMPPMQHGNYLVFYKGKLPIGYVSWAYLSKEAEVKYLENPHSLVLQDWVSGDRMWFLDIIVLEGHTRTVTSLLRKQIFPDEVVRSLRVKEGSSRGRVRTWHGVNKRGASKFSPPIDFSLSEKLKKKS